MLPDDIKSKPHLRLHVRYPFGLTSHQPLWQITWANSTWQERGYTLWLNHPASCVLDYLGIMMTLDRPPGDEYTLSLIDQLSES